ncbi:hypothetical protein E2320_009684 [Naja naja]|nr:hypothetical protein E2320_009684 [Naja naja]
MLLVEGDGRKLKGAIQRSTETGLAVEMPSRTIRQASHESIEDSMNSYGSEGKYEALAASFSQGHDWNLTESLMQDPLTELETLYTENQGNLTKFKAFACYKNTIILNFNGVHLASAGQFSDFLGSMGPAQFVGRQTLATTSMGDVEIGLQERNGQLEVDIIQARGLTAKPGSKTLPAAYIKAYLLENGVCIAKKKTKVARKSLDPLYNQITACDKVCQRKKKSYIKNLSASIICVPGSNSIHILFVPKVIVWGNYGRMERKYFMGVARVLLEELDLSTLAVGWYKLFPTSSMVDPTTAPLLRQSSQLSLESTVGPCCDRS